MSLGHCGADRRAGQGRKRHLLLRPHPSPSRDYLRHEMEYEFQGAVYQDPVVLSRFMTALTGEAASPCGRPFLRRLSLWGHPIFPFGMGIRWKPRSLREGACPRVRVFPWDPSHQKLERPQSVQGAPSACSGSTSQGAEPRDPQAL